MPTPLEEFNSQDKMPGPNTPSPTTPHPDALKLPARFDRCLLPQLAPDGRCVYSTDALEYMLVAKLGYSREEARVWLLHVTADTSPGTPDFLD